MIWRKPQKAPVVPSTLGRYAIWQKLGSIQQAKRRQSDAFCATIYGQSQRKKGV